MESGKYAYNASIVWFLYEDPERQTKPIRKRLNLFLNMAKTNYHFTRGNNLYCFDKSISKISEIPNHGDQLGRTKHTERRQKGKKR